MSTPETKKLEHTKDKDSPRAVAKVIVIRNDGSVEEVLNEDRTALILGFAVPLDENEREINVRFELVQWGIGKFLGEIYYQLGVQEPNLIKYCVSRSLGNRKQEKRLDAMLAEVPPAGNA